MILTRYLPPVGGLDGEIDLGLAVAVAGSFLVERCGDSLAGGLDGRFAFEQPDVGADQPLAVVAGKLGEPVIDIGELFVLVERVDAIGDGIEDLLVAFELVAPLFALAHVPEIHRQPLLVGVGGDLEPRIQRREGGLEGDRLLAVDGVGVSLLEDGVFGRREGVPDDLADNLLGVDPEQRFRPIVDVDEPPVVIEREEGVVDPAEHRSELTLCRPKLLFLQVVLELVGHQLGHKLHEQLILVGQRRAVGVGAVETQRSVGRAVDPDRGADILDAAVGFGGRQLGELRRVGVDVVDPVGRSLIKCSVAVGLRQRERCPGRHRAEQLVVAVDDLDTVAVVAHRGDDAGIHPEVRLADIEHGRDALLEGAAGLGQRSVECGKRAEVARRRGKSCLTGRRCCVVGRCCRVSGCCRGCCVAFCVGCADRPESIQQGDRVGRAVVVAEMRVGDALLSGRRQRARRLTVGHTGYPSVGGRLFPVSGDFLGHREIIRDEDAVDGGRRHGRTQFRWIGAGNEGKIDSRLRAESVEHVAVAVARIPEYRESPRCLARCILPGHVASIYVRVSCS